MPLPSRTRRPMQTAPGVIPATIVNAVLDLLFPLLIAPAKGNAAVARQAALEAIAEYGPATREEYRLAGEIIAFSLQALSALRAAALPGTPNGAYLRLLNTANGLRRNEAAAQRKFDALKRARLGPVEKAPKRFDAPHAETMPAPEAAQPMTGPRQAKAAAALPTPGPQPPPQAEGPTAAQRALAHVTPVAKASVAKVPAVAERTAQVVEGTAPHMTEDT